MSAKQAFTLISNDGLKCRTRPKPWDYTLHLGGLYGVPQEPMSYLWQSAFYYGVGGMYGDSAPNGISWDSIGLNTGPTGGYSPTSAWSNIIGEIGFLGEMRDNSAKIPYVMNFDDETFDYDAFLRVTPAVKGKTLSESWNEMGTDELADRIGDPCSTQRCTRPETPRPY